MALNQYKNTSGALFKQGFIRKAREKDLFIMLDPKKLKLRIHARHGKFLSWNWTLQKVIRVNKPCTKSHW